MRGLSLVVASGGHSSSWCSGLSLSQPLLLRSTGSRRAGSVVLVHGPNCSTACGILPDQGSNPCSLHRQADSQPLCHQEAQDASFTNVFSDSVACLFIILIVIFKEQKFSILMKSSLSILSFMDCAFGVMF